MPYVLAYLTAIPGKTHMFKSVRPSLKSKLKKKNSKNCLTIFHLSNTSKYFALYVAM